MSFQLGFSPHARTLSIMTASSWSDHHCLATLPSLSPALGLCCGLGLDELPMDDADTGSVGTPPNAPPYRLLRYCCALITLVLLSALPPAGDARIMGTRALVSGREGTTDDTAARLSKAALIASAAEIDGPPPLVFNALDCIMSKTSPCGVK